MTGNRGGFRGERRWTIDVVMADGGKRADVVGLTEGGHLCDTATGERRRGARDDCLSDPLERKEKAKRQ